MKKNVASQVIGIQMINSADGTAFTGTATVVITVDGGTQSASGGTGPTHEGNGYHTYLPTQAETNGDQIGFTFTGSGAVTSTVQVYTTFPQSADNDTLLTTIDGNVDAILLDTAEIGTAGAGLTDLGGMSTAMKAEVNAECDTALTDYDGPTNTEMEARTLLAADYFDPAADTVANVTTVANMRGTDSALLASAAPANFGDLAITVTTGQVTVGTNNDKSGYSISGTITTLDGLNNFDPATDTVALVTDVTNELSVNVAKVNGVTVIGAGTAGDLWRA